ncbi:MAG: hypothetical protein N4A33_04130 [Bacteriovoracaceae bacterium]|jgi:D-glycero-alpha-D-manno-heptose-7-phosphate kinase|nr:hypothetical protein [Bacteriovoracaceae bacterium]
MLVTEGSVRVDLVGGTLDLDPINLILANVVTLNVATSLKAKVILKSREDKIVKIISKDYASEFEYQLSDFTDINLYQNNFFSHMTFMCQIIHLFRLTEGIEIELSSGSPAGAGLGGSSSMGATLYKALCEFTDTSFEVHQAVKRVKSCEARILNQGVPGYQDYYPALTGGVLALKNDGTDITFEQLYSEELVSFIEEHLTLVFSGITRDSGINNWKVYKDFFDNKNNVRSSLEKIADVSFQTYNCIKNKDYKKVIHLIGKEGELRKGLADLIVPHEVEQLLISIKDKFNSCGLKMCGAGGGGCFIITHPKEAKSFVLEQVYNHAMTVLDFKVERPL